MLLARNNIWDKYPTSLGQYCILYPGWNAGVPRQQLSKLAATLTAKRQSPGLFVPAQVPALSLTAMTSTTGPAKNLEQEQTTSLSQKPLKEEQQEDTEEPTTASGHSDVPENSQELSEEEQVRSWEDNGEMHQVVGSQSMLSQELTCFATVNADDQASCQSVMSFRPNQTPAKMAQQTGLVLSQELQDDIPPKDQDSASSHELPGDLPEKALEDNGTSQATNVDFLFAQSQGNSTLGPLLDAIQLQEEMGGADFASNGPTSRGNKHPRHLEDSQPTNKRRKTSPSTVKNKSAATASASPNVSKPTENKLTPRISLSPMRASNPPSRATNQKMIDQEMAAKSAALAARVLKDANLAKSLLLRMALARQPPSRLILPPLLPKGGRIPENFVWAHFPPLEKVLKECMADYYELSLKQCQSQEQQNFNNRLVELIREEAEERGWSWAPKFDSFKLLRDRVRCYYKTHIQNAKKRLRTMLRNPTKRANARHLQLHWDLLQDTLQLAEEEGIGQLEKAPPGVKSVDGDGAKDTAAAEESPVGPPSAETREERKPDSEPSQDSVMAAVSLIVESNKQEAKEKGYKDPYSLPDAAYSQASYSYVETDMII